MSFTNTLKPHNISRQVFPGTQVPLDIKTLLCMPTLRIPDTKEMVRIAAPAIHIRSRAGYSSLNRVYLARLYHLTFSPSLLLGCTADVEGDALVHMWLPFLLLIPLLLLFALVESVLRFSVRFHQIIKTPQRVRWDLIFLLGRGRRGSQVSYVHDSLFLLTAYAVPVDGKAA